MSTLIFMFEAESSKIAASPATLDLFVSEVIAVFYRLDFGSSGCATIYSLVSFKFSAETAVAIGGAFHITSSLCSSIDI